MTTPTNWPNPERPGVPMFPERDGWHVLYTYSRSLSFWDSANKYWWNSQKRFYRTIPEILKDTVGTQYIGPCLTPAQINEMLATERERISDQTQNMLTLAMSRFDIDTINSTLEEMRPTNDRSDWTEYAHTKSDFVDEAKKRFQQIYDLGVAS